MQPNGLVFSCRERAPRSVPRPYDLAREAVCCNTGLGGRVRYRVPIGKTELL